MVNYETIDNLLVFKHNSWIVEVQYNTDDKSMKVFTKKTTYKCQGVPLDVFEEFAQTPLKGRYFNLYIKDKYMDEFFK